MKVYSIIVFFVFVFSLEAHSFVIKTKEVLKRELTSRAVALDVWVDKTNSEGFDFLCLGESHTDFFRSFYSEKVFSKLKLNALALEALQSPVDLAVVNYVEKRLSTPNIVTGVDVNPVLEQVVLNNGDAVTFFGVERTREEAALITKAQIDQFGINKSDTIINRETFIASHIEEIFDQGFDRVAALYGSKHCAKFSTENFGFTTPFYRLLFDKYDKKMKSIFVVKKSDRDNILRIYASEFGLLDEDIVFENLDALNPEDYNYNLMLKNIFETYDAVILESK